MEKCIVLIFLMCGLSGNAQLIISSSLGQVIFVDIEEEENHDITLVCSDEIVQDSIYHEKIFRIDADLNAFIDSRTLDFTDYLNFPDVVRGNLIKKNGNLEFVGIAGHLTSFSANPFSSDSSVFVRMSMSYPLSEFQVEKIGLLNQYLFSNDFLYDETNSRYVGTAYQSVFTYRVLSVEENLNSNSLSISIYNAGEPEWNPRFLTKVLMPPSGTDIAVRTSALSYDLFSETAIQVGSNSPALGEPLFAIFMTKALIKDGTSIYSMSPEGFGHNATVAKYIYPWESGTSFSFVMTDSTLTGCIEYCMDMNTSHELFLGMHIQADVDDYPKTLKVIKCDTLGTLIWQANVSEGLDVKYDVQKVLATEDGGAIIAAERYADPYSEEADGIILYKIDAQGNVLGLSENNHSYTSASIFPNPTSNLLNITLPDYVKVQSMLLYDQVGRLVMNIGTTERQISLDDVSPGSYILSVHSADAIQNLKVIKN